jgi:hypothetical protein
MAASKDLTDAVKTFIVTRLACWDTPSAVAKAVKEEFDHDISRQAVEAYDPTKVQGKALSEKWRSVFEEARRLYLATTSDIAIAQQTFRLRALERRLAHLELHQPSNTLAILSVLEQAAKEMGGAYTNNRNLKHDVSDPLREMFKAISGTAFRPTDG